MGAAMLAVSHSLSQAAWAQAPAAPSSAASAASAPPAEQSPATASPAAPTPEQAPAQAPAATPVTTAAPSGGTIKGTVKIGAVPLPGVAVTAKNSLTGKTYATTTDVDGNYSLAIPKNGRYVVKAELAAFAATTKEVVLNAASENGGLPEQKAEFTLELASRATPAAATVAATPGAGTGRTGAAAGLIPGASRPGTPGAVSRVGRGTQVVAAAGTDEDAEGATGAGVNNTADVAAPSMNGLGGDDMAAGGGDSIAVSGQQGQTNALAGFSQEDIQNRIQNAANDIRNQGGNPADINNGIAGMLTGAISNGGFGGPGGGPFGGPPGGGGGFGGPGGGGPGGGGGGRGGGGGGGRGGGGGAFRGQNPNAWHGSFAYTGADSALNANAWSPAGTQAVKPASDRNTLIGSLTGTPYIPGLTKPNPKQFVFISVQETRNTTPSLQDVVVPTAAQRLGDLTNAYQAGLTPGQTFQGAIYDPNTNSPFGNTNCNPALAVVDASPSACIPVTELSKAGLALLNYYPLPNITPNSLGDNYQANTTTESHQSQISGRYNRSFGAAPVRGQRGQAGARTPGQRANVKPVLRQSIAENFAYSHTASSSTNLSPLLGGKSVSNGYSFTSSYTVGYGRLNNTATVGWNRSRAEATNYFTDGTVNPAVTAGVFVGNPTIYSNPFYYGLPSVNISGIGGVYDLTNTTPSNKVNQTITISDQAGWSHKRHNMRYGIDFHRIHADTIGGTNVLGSFTFSGFSTEGTALQAAGCVTSITQPCGSPVADLLLGLPQQTGITAGLSKIYLRGNSWDWYANDDWRVKAGLTLNFGLRWEYFSPYSEKYGHLVNLNLTESATITSACSTTATVCPAITNVCATASAGCAAVGSNTLVKADKSMYSPRVSLAWSPKYKFAKNTVVRLGFGINYNTGQYALFAQKLSFQQPFSVTQTNTLSTPTSPTTCTPANMSLNVLNGGATGFNCSTQTTQSNYGVDPNYRLGWVQVYSLDIQRTLGMGVVLNVGYNGALGSNLDIVRAPNRNAIGILNSTSGQFNYEDSLGYSRANVLAVNARKRLQKGVSLQATYTYGHSIDDASSVGGSGNSIAQNDQNLGAEESNSSFLQRQNLTGSWVYEPPFGPNRAFLNKGGLMAKIFDGYSISGAFTFATGGYLTPVYSGTSSEIAAGAGNSLRPDRVPGVSIFSTGSQKSWFNKAAFSAPAPGTYGDAARNSIEGPGTVSTSGSLSRTVSLGETRNFEARITANNIFNTVQYSGVGTSLTSNSFGQITSAAGMRSLTYTARFRF
jgi:hypothetical protein